YRFGFKKRAISSIAASPTSEIGRQTASAYRVWSRTPRRRDSGPAPGNPSADGADALDPSADSSLSPAAAYIRIRDIHRSKSGVPDGYVIGVDPPRLGVRLVRARFCCSVALSLPVRP